MWLHSAITIFLLALTINKLLFSFSMLELVSELKYAQQPLSLVLVDYIQLMRGDTKGSRE